MVNDITIIIKTFERRNELWNLLSSIRKYFPELKILIADDSKINYKESTLKKFDDLNIDYYLIPFDSGLAYGRNFLLEEVSTEFFLLCDDDFEFDRKTNIKEALSIIKDKKIDILGGYVRNYIPIKRKFDYFLRGIEKILKVEFKRNFIGDIQINENEITINYFTRKFPDYLETDLVLNFFIGNKKSIQDFGGWNNKLKLNEHTDFFINCKKNRVKVAFTNTLSVKHFPNKIGHYFEFRSRNFVGNLLELHDVERINFYYDKPNSSYALMYDENKVSSRCFKSFA